MLFYVLSVCKCVLYYCHQVSTQLQLNIYHIISCGSYMICQSDSLDTQEIYRVAETQLSAQ